MRSRRPLFLLCWLVAIVSFLSGPVRANDGVLEIGPAFAAHDLRGVAALFVDPAGRATATELLAAPQRFAPLTAASGNLGFTAAHAWLRFTLRYAPGVRESLVLVLPKPLLDHVELHVFDAAGGHRLERAGDAHPRHGLRYRAPAFVLPPTPGAEVTYLLRVASPTSAIEVGPRLLGLDAFSALEAGEGLAFGGYFGLMAGLVVGTLLFWLVSGATAFAAYAAYCGSYLAAMATVNGYAALYLWPHATLLPQIAPVALVTLAIAAGNYFVRRYVLAELRSRVVDVLFGVGLATAIAGLALHVVRPGGLGIMVVIGTVVALCPLVLLCCLLAVRAGARVPRYFLVGWLAYMIGGLVSAADMLGLVPDSLLSQYGLYLGSLVEFIALSVALADHVVRLQREREREVARANDGLRLLNADLEGMVQRRTGELEARNRELTELAIRDGLTGLYNHSTTIELLDQLLQQGRRYAFPVAAVMVDLDHFKRINDEHGHQVGDAVLEAVAAALLESVRGADVVGRYGGEEFLVAMPHADAPAARDYGERLRECLRTIDDVPGFDGPLSASIGVAIAYPGAVPLGAPELVRRADDALYRSKRDGRDRVTVGPLTPVPGSQQA